jgi:hypothetical protein
MDPFGFESHFPLQKRKNPRIKSLEVFYFEGKGEKIELLTGHSLT